MGNRYVRDEGKAQYWRSLLADWRSGGLSVRDFCRLRRVSEASFYAWRKTLQQRQADSAGPAFVPVQVVADEQADTPGAAIELLLPRQRSVRVGPGFDATTLRRLLAVLEEEPC
jgi:hypothetical protein